MSRAVIEQLVDTLERITSGIVRAGDDHIRVPEAAFDVAAEAIVAARAALAEPEPEQVGHLHSNGDFCLDRSVTPSGDWPIPLYATPPQRKPLTDEQIKAAARNALIDPGIALDIARAVERAHGIGGGQ